jgi:hypothetical protein
LFLCIGLTHHPVMAKVKHGGNKEKRLAVNVKSQFACMLKWWLVATMTILAIKIVSFPAMHYSAMSEDSIANLSYLGALLFIGAFYALVLNFVTRAAMNIRKRWDKEPVKEINKSVGFDILPCIWCTMKEWRVLVLVAYSATLSYLLFYIF